MPIVQPPAGEPASVTVEIPAQARSRAAIGAERRGGVLRIQPGRQARQGGGRVGPPRPVPRRSRLAERRGGLAPAREAGDEIAARTHPDFMGRRGPPDLERERTQRRRPRQGRDEAPGADHVAGPELHEHVNVFDEIPRRGGEDFAGQGGEVGPIQSAGQLQERSRQAGLAREDVETEPAQGAPSGEDVVVGADPGRAPPIGAHRAARDPGGDLVGPGQHVVRAGRGGPLRGRRAPRRVADPQAECRAQRRASLVLRQSGEHRKTLPRSRERVLPEEVPHQALAPGPEEIPRAEAGLEQRDVEPAQIAHRGLANLAGEVVPSAQRAIQCDLAPHTVGEVAGQQRLANHPVAGPGVEADDADRRVGGPLQRLDHPLPHRRGGEGPGGPEVAVFEGVEVVCGVCRCAVLVPGRETVLAPGGQPLALEVRQGGAMLAGPGQAAKIGRILAVPGRHLKRQDAGADRQGPGERRHLFAERGSVRQAERGLHRGLEIDEARHRAVGDQVVEPEVVGVQGLQEREPAAERREEGIGFVPAGDRTRLEHRLPGVAVPHQKGRRGECRAVEPARDLADDGRDPQILRLVHHAAALETQDRHRTSAGMGIAEPRLDPDQCPGVLSAEEGAREGRPVRRGASGDPGEAGKPVRGGPAERVGEDRASLDARLPGRPGAHLALDPVRRQEHVAEGTGKVVEGTFQHVRPARQLRRPPCPRLGPDPAAELREGERPVREPLEHVPERARPVRLGAREAHVAETVEPRFRAQPESVGMGRHRLSRSEGFLEPIPPPRQGPRVGLDRLERARARPLRRWRGAGDDGVEVQEERGGPPRMKSPTVPSTTGSSPVARANVAESAAPMPHGESPSSVAARYRVWYSAPALRRMTP